jgi:hypothetical protein
VVVAVGFDPLWFVPLLGRGAHDALAEAVGEAPGRPPTRAALERVIDHDLAVPGLRPRLCPAEGSTVGARPRPTRPLAKDA